MLRRIIGSLALRGVRGTLDRIAQEFSSRPTIDHSLNLLPLDDSVACLAFPVCAAPRVSVIIPTYGKLAYTATCLRSLMQHSGASSFEVLVVDDASPDESARVLSGIPGLKILINPQNAGFVQSCNAGAAAARGEFLLFLNNDTQVTSGWLDALLRCFADRPDCGIAGSRLIYPDGRLQEAGALVFGDGSCWNTGRFEARDSPAFRYRREVDYVSGAALLIRTEVFRRIGAFDIRYAPAYYEDVDLAFAARQLGLRVYYEPASTVVHCEGVSAGTDLDSGMKMHQRSNQAKFVEKWVKELTAQPPTDTSLERAIRWRRRGRVLVVDAMTPDPTRDSGSMRLCAMLELLDRQGWSTAFFPDDGRATSDEMAALGALGCEVLCKPWIPDLPHWLSRHGRDLHAVIMSRHTVAGQYLGLVRQHAPQARLIFDTVDLHFLREERAARLAKSQTLMRQAETSRRSELALIDGADVTLVVSLHEKNLLSELAPQARVVVLSNIHQIQVGTSPHALRKDLVFIGGHGHPPNSDAIEWMARDILPRLRAAMPDIQVNVLGDMPEARRRELQTPGLNFHGRVGELDSWLNGCLATLAPLRFGAGVKGKINTSMSHGVPVIATTLAVEGMQLHDGVDVLVADDAATFVAAVQRLQGDETLWRNLSNHGVQNVREHYSPAAAGAVLRQVLN
jgi:GT2 family glycosyltransferase/glycosyltransferase involved in cell wall biosynthesis